MLVYFSFLYVRYRAQIVTDEMLKLPKWRFVLVGFLEALGVASGMAAGGNPRILYTSVYLETRFTLRELDRTNLSLMKS